MVSMPDCGSVLSVAEIVEQAILIVSANKKYLECLIELQRTVIIKYVEPKDRSLGKTRQHFGGC